MYCMAVVCFTIKEHTFEQIRTFLSGLLLLLILLLFLQSSWYAELGLEQCLVDWFG